MMNEDARLHVRGESLFIDDEPTPTGTLFACVFTSPAARGVIRKFSCDEAAQSDGVCAVLTAADIPGENQIGGVIPDEPLLAEGSVHFIGQPIALVVATSAALAYDAAQKIICVIDEQPPILDPREAFAKGEIIVQPKTFSIGDVDAAWSECDLVIGGRADSGSQEHIYLETQGAIAIPTESNLTIISATQGPTSVQRTVARVLGLPMQQIEVNVRRLGGGFGGKEDQATGWAVLAAVGAFKTNKPVKLVLSREEDIRYTGKRHPYSSDYKIGLARDGKIIAYEVFFYQNAGAAADLSPAILDRTLFHSTNSYFIPNVRATAVSCRTNLAPFTAFRGFGGPQAMFVLEAAIDQAARALGVEARSIQEKNLLKENDALPYGQRVRACNAGRCFTEVKDRFQFDAESDRVEEFNRENRLVKKGLAMMPVCFGISFTTTFMNQASALVHVHIDGTVSISTAAVEMGQGVNMKLRTIAANEFGIPIDRVRVLPTNTTRNANTPPTAASKDVDLNGFAVMKAARAIRDRLIDVAANELGKPAQVAIAIRDGIVWADENKTDVTFQRLAHAAYRSRVNLSAHVHHVTPEIYFDSKANRGKPFAYHVFGSAMIEVTLDCVRGTHTVDAVRVVHDAGRSLDPLIDLGQAEGAIVQGIGWMTMEELLWDARGRLMTDALSTYKIPDINSAPWEMDVHFLDAENDFGPLQSKAIGEPPFMYGIGVYFALLRAMRAYRPSLAMRYDAPLTPEKILIALYPG